MGLYGRLIFPYLCHCAMSKAVMRPFRARVAGSAEGQVLEIGIGSGFNLAHYGPAACSVIGIDPSPELLRFARRRSTSAAPPYELIEGSAEYLPLDDETVDTVITTWTLCTIPDVGRALSEVRRVLRPNGALLFVEHGLHPKATIARWQDRLDPIWTSIAGGCHLNRPIVQLLKQAGFHIEQLQTARLPGPPTHTFLYEGRAVPK